MSAKSLVVVQKSIKRIAIAHCHGFIQFIRTLIYILIQLNVFHKRLVVGCIHGISTFSSQLQAINDLIIGTHHTCKILSFMQTPLSHIQPRNGITIRIRTVSSIFILIRHPCSQCIDQVDDLSRTIIITAVVRFPPIIVDVRQIGMGLQTVIYLNINIGTYIKLFTATIAQDAVLSKKSNGVHIPEELISTRNTDVMLMYKT